MTTKTKDELAQEAAEMIREFLLIYHRESGIPVDCILSGAHAQVVGMMAATFGGPMAAKCCDAAANNVRNLPSAYAAQLAMAQPSGSA